MTHEQIWAPWRLSYIQTDLGGKKPQAVDLPYLEGADPDCFLCQCVADTADRQRGVVLRAEHCLVVLNRYPYNNGHLLVAPKKHVARLDQLDDGVALELTQTIGRMTALLEKTLQPQGFNVGLNLGRVAGAGLPGHLHWHIVPRWNGDTNFMPVLGNVNVIPQSLDALWQLLTDALAGH